MRLADKVAIVVGAGQTPGDTIGNGRATAVLFAREGARVLLVDRSEDAARETAAQIEREGAGKQCEVFQADVTNEQECRALQEVRRFFSSGALAQWPNRAPPGKLPISQYRQYKKCQHIQLIDNMLLMDEREADDQLHSLRM